METNRLSPTLAAALNAQMTNEAHNAQIYLAYANEERNHMMKFLEYILKRGAKVVVTAIPAPGANPTSVNDCFEKVFKYEVENTTKIYDIVNMAMAEKDWATWNFLQWFVKEQTEEETLALDLLSKIKVAGGEKAAHDVTVEKP
jgi:ferritin